jgi:hypothetical protein
MRIVPASGGAEVKEITIVRWSSLTAVKEAQLSDMHLTLWFPTDWKTKDQSHYLIRIKSLDPIEDDTGKLLLTEKCRESIDGLHDEQRAELWHQADGRAGPELYWWLEVPARRAETIKSTKGKVEVTLAKEIRLTFKDLAAINGKELDHSDFPGLRDMKLKFAIKSGFFA